jgi:hypothetical protein
LFSIADHLLLLLLLLLPQGLNKNDMITLVTGSHSIGGFRTFSSPDLTDCPYVPFDCTAAGEQTARSSVQIICVVVINGRVMLSNHADCPYLPVIQLHSSRCEQFTQLAAAISWDAVLLHAASSPC